MVDKLSPEETNQIDLMADTAAQEAVESIKSENTTSETDTEISVTEDNINVNKETKLPIFSETASIASTTDETTKENNADPIKEIIATTETIQNNADEDATLPTEEVPEVPEAPEDVAVATEEEETTTITTATTATTNTTTSLTIPSNSTTTTPLLLTPKPLQRNPVKSSSTLELRVELGSDGITEALLGSLSSRSTASARGRRARPRLGPIKQGTKTYLARSIVPILIEGLTQLSIVRPEPTLSTMGPGVWLANFLLERSSQSQDYEIRRKNVGLNIKTQTMYDDEYPPIARKVDNETQTRLGGRAAQVSIGDGTRGMIGNEESGINGNEYGNGGVDGSLNENSQGANKKSPSLINELKELALMLSMGVLTIEEFSEAKKLIFKTAERKNATPRPSPPQQRQLPPRQRTLSHQSHQSNQPYQPHQSHQSYQSYQSQEEDNGTATYPIRPSSQESSIVLQGEQTQMDQMYESIGSPTNADLQQEINGWNNQDELSETNETNSINTPSINNPSINNPSIPTSSAMTPDHESTEEEDTRQLFMKFDRNGSGIISTIDLLSELPSVVPSPLFQRVASRSSNVLNLSKPRTYKNEIDKLRNDGDIDITSFTKWMNDNNDNTSKNNNDDNNNEDNATQIEETSNMIELYQKQGIDLRRPRTKRKAKKLEQASSMVDLYRKQGIDLRRPRTKRKEQQVALGEDTVPTTPLPTTAKITPFPNLIDMPANVEQNKRLKLRIKKRIKRDKILFKLFNALDVRGDSKLDRTEILLALGRGTNDQVNALLTYHSDDLLQLTTPSRWKGAFNAMKNVNDDANGNYVTFDAFRSFATAVLSARGETTTGDDTEEMEEDSTARINLDDRIELENKQWSLLSTVFNALTTTETLSKVDFITGIVTNVKGVQDLINSENGICIRMLKYVKRYGRSLEMFETSIAGSMNVIELSAFVGALTTETVDEEGVMFGEKVEGSDEYDY